MHPIEGQTPIPPPPSPPPAQLSVIQCLAKLCLALLGTITVVPLFFAGRKILSLYVEGLTGKAITAQKTDYVMKATLNPKKEHAKIEYRNLHEEVQKELLDVLKKKVLLKEHIPEKPSPKIEFFYQTQLPNADLLEKLKSFSSSNDRSDKKINVFLACFFKNTQLTLNDFDSDIIQHVKTALTTLENMCSAYKSIETLENEAEKVTSQEAFNLFFNNCKLFLNNLTVPINQEAYTLTNLKKLTEPGSYSTERMDTIKTGLQMLKGLGGFEGLKDEENIKPSITTLLNELPF